VIDAGTSSILSITRLPETIIRSISFGASLAKEGALTAKAMSVSDGLNMKTLLRK
jgi:hypothetical protein